MPRVLVLEDESLIAMMLADWLQEMGLEVAGPVATAREALAIIDTTGIDAALLDLHLRDGNSYAVAARLRSSGVPFAFASGEGAGGLAEVFCDCPMISKPFEFESVEAVFRGWHGDVRSQGA